MSAKLKYEVVKPKVNGSVRKPSPVLPPATQACMGLAGLAEMVKEGEKLHREIEEKDKRLKEIDKALKAYALANPSRHEPLEDPEREGRQVFIAWEGGALPVIITADLLRQSFEEGSEEYIAIGEAADVLTAANWKTAASRSAFAEAFEGLYARKVTWQAKEKDGKQFRAILRSKEDIDADAVLKELIRRDKDGIAVNQVKIEWERAREEEA